MSQDLFQMAARVGAIPDPSRRLTRYQEALTRAAQMAALPQYIVDRAERIANTRSWALRRLGELEREDRERVEAVQGAIE